MKRAHHLRVRRKNSRGQAALEYLVTYGWGFIAILVVLGALAYFGFLNPTKYLPARCSFGSQLDCQDFQLAAASLGSDNGCVMLKVTNNFGDDLRISDAFIESIDAELYNVTSCNEPVDAPEETDYVIIPRGGTSVFRVLYPQTTNQILIDDERQTAAITLEFSRNIIGAPSHELTGQIFTTVVERS